MEGFSVTKSLLYLLLVAMAIMAIPAMGATLTDISGSTSEVNAGGDASSVQSGTSAIAACGDVVTLGQLATEANAWNGKSVVTQNSKQGVTKADDVVMQSIVASDQYAKKGGALTQTIDQDTCNKGDTFEMAVGTANQVGGLKANFKDLQSITQDGYGAEDNQVTGILDLNAVTGPCGSVTATQKETKSIDPKNVVAWDQESACINSGNVNFGQSIDDTIGATKSIDSTRKIDATTFAWDSSTVTQSSKGKYFSPGDISSLADNYNKNTAIGGDASTTQKIVTDVNTHPWSTHGLPGQVINLGSFNQDEVTSIFSDAANNQETTTTVV